MERVEHEKNKVSINNHFLVDKIIFFLYSSYFILMPFYLWQSGLPQIADVIMIVLIVTFTLKKKAVFKATHATKKFLIIGLLFTSYVTLVNIFWILIMGDTDTFLMTSFYYIYNYINLAMLFFLYTEYGDKILNVIYNAILSSILIQVILLFIGGGFTGERMIGSFNNPNQLGYYALITTVIMIVISTKINIKPQWFIVGLLSNALMVIASLSTSTIIAYIILIISLIFFKMDDKRHKKYLLVSITAILVAVMALYTTTDFFEESLMINGLEARLNTIEQKTSIIVQDRGYNRILEYPQYWIFGAGEGSYDQRFGFGNEFHSLLGNIQVSYGVIGLILFMRLLYLTIKNKKNTNKYILLVILIYGITHNSVRSPLLWILFSLMVLKEE